MQWEYQYDDKPYKIAESALFTKWKNFAVGVSIPITAGLLGWLSVNLGNLEQKSKENPHISPQTILLEEYTPKAELPNTPYKTEFSDNTVDIDNIEDNITQPRGIRNNNPGNIERTNTQWEGMAEEQTDGRFVSFDSPEYGIRAMARILKNYQKKYQFKTISEIILRWAPNGENEAQSYIKHVSDQIGVSPTSPIDLSNNEILKNLIKAMIRHENGGNFYDDTTIQQGIELEKRSNSDVNYRYAYKKTEWLQAKLLVLQLAHQKFNWPLIAQKLIQTNVPKKWFGKLNEIFLVETSYITANCVWTYKY